MKRAMAMAALMWGCADEASVGDLTCKATDNCQRAALGEPVQLTPVATSGLTALPARWTRPGFEAASLHWKVATAIGSNGSLWVFRGGVGEVIATLLDANGDVLGEQHIGPPPGGLVPPGGQVWTSFSNSHPLGPVATVNWEGTCVSTSGLAADPGCAHYEVLVFSNDSAVAPIRLQADDLEPESRSITAAFRSQQGDSVLSAQGYTVSAFDLSGRRIAKQTLTGALANALERNSVLENAATRAARDLNGALVFNLQWDNAERGQLHGTLLQVPANGGTPLLLDHEFTDDGLLGVSADGPFGGVAVDARGRYLLPMNNNVGDLIVLRLDGAKADGFRLVRDGFANVWEEARAVDPAGTLYVEIATGGREPSTQYSALCALPMDGTPVCRSISERHYILESPAVGVVYGLGQAGLSRYEL